MSMTDPLPIRDVHAPAARHATPLLTMERVGGPGWHAMVALRHRVLRAPLGLRFTDADLAAEADQRHVALWLGDTLAGTVLLLPPDPSGSAKLRQMAIDPALTGRGLGTLLLRHAEAELLRLGATEARLSARATATGFYARLGYIPEGAPYVEVTLPHRLMRHRLHPGHTAGVEDCPQMSGIPIDARPSATAPASGRCSDARPGTRLYPPGGSPPDDRDDHPGRRDALLRAVLRPRPES